MNVLCSSRVVILLDGFNSFGNLSQSYNMWPVILTTYNLPSHGYVFWDKKVSLSGWSGQGYKACHTVMKKLIYGVKQMLMLAQKKILMESPNKWRSSRGFNGDTDHRSHDCHIMMQRLLLYGLQNYLPDNIAKPIIELSSLFKQLCSATLMEDDMLKAVSVKVGPKVPEICVRHAKISRPQEVSTSPASYSLLGLMDLQGLQCQDGESTEVDAPPDIIDVPGEDDDISDDEDPFSMI
ncbi:putative receptor-like protein kinase [Tanacetum coccineum]